MDSLEQPILAIASLGEHVKKTSLSLFSDLMTGNEEQLKENFDQLEKTIESLQNHFEMVKSHLKKGN